MKRLGIFSILALVLCYSGLMFWGCSTNEYTASADPEYVDYGQGVLYFPYTHNSLGRALSEFLKKNDSYRVVSLAPDDTGAYGTTIGYFVVVEYCCPTLRKHDLK